MKHVISAVFVIVVVAAAIWMWPRAKGPGAGGKKAPAATDADAPSMDTTVYSALNQDIVPPSFARPRLPSDPPRGVNPKELSEVQVLVAPSGEVESVKLVTHPVRIIPAMMLSAMKTWRFQPAMKDGQPVRYRLRLRVPDR